MWLLGWVALSIAVGWFWQQKGLSLGAGIAWSLLLSPLVGFVIGLLRAPDAGAREARELAGGKRKCPFCAELVKREAVVCRFCGRDLPPPGATPPGPDRPASGW